MFSFFVIIMVGAAAGYGAYSLWQDFYPGTSQSPDTLTDAQAMTTVISLVNTGKDWEILVNRIKNEEGFRSLTYQDTRGFSTIGYGTKLPLLDSDWHCFNRASRRYRHAKMGSRWIQSDCLLKSRLSDHYLELVYRWAPFTHQPDPVQMALLDMCYQLGVDGLLEFRLMLSAIVNKDWVRAIAEARASRWDKETPSRVRRVVTVF